MCIASHIDTTILADGTYELVPESESEQREAQVNLTEATEDPNHLLFLYTCAFKFKGVD